MAEETSRVWSNQGDTLHPGSDANPALDSGCSPEELALYEGVEQLGMASGRSGPLGEIAGSHAQSSDTTNDTVESTLHNELINLEQESSPAANQVQSQPLTEGPDLSSLPAQRTSPPRTASALIQNDPITELDMYAEQPINQNAWDERQDEVRHPSSSSHNELAAAQAPSPARPEAAETELDGYEAMRRVGDEPLRGGGAGLSSPNHHNQGPNSAPVTSSTRPASDDPSPINPADAAEEQSHSSGRTKSIVLPRWQPDAEVTYCPICSSQFSFFNRKHHCRKCGRVVCATCSQHRITIPHEFIVHPPEDTSSTNRRPSLPKRDTEAASTTCGGTKVRLCNPCVPDPNTLPPPPTQSPEAERRTDRPTYLLSGYGQDQYRITEEALRAFEHMGSQPSSTPSQRQRTVSYSTAPTVQRAPFPESRFPPRTSSQHIRNTSLAGPHFRSPRRSQPPPLSHSYGARRPYMPSYIPPPPPQAQDREYNNDILNPAIRPHQGQIVHSLLNPSAPPPPAPRHDIPDEDRCPVCREDLMAISETERRRRVAAGNVEGWSDEIALSVRERHTNDCFEQQASLMSGRGRREQSIPEGSPMASATGTPGGDAMAGVGAAGPSAPPIRAPRRVYGLFPFQATEKDCIDDAECSICLEDFAPGAKMARLECFCRFHEACIRNWWEKKPGMCPVHGHNMEGL